MVHELNLGLNSKIGIPKENDAIQNSKLITHPLSERRVSLHLERVLQERLGTTSADLESLLALHLVSRRARWHYI